MTGARRRWWRRGGAALAAALVLATAACGIPGSGAPVIDGDGPVLGQRDALDVATPPGPDGNLTADSLVRRYLAAAAGRMDGAVGRVKDFMTPAEQKKWTANPNQITIARIDVGQARFRSNDSYEVRVQVTPVGLLDAQGAVDALPRPQAPYTATFTVDTVAQGLRISGAPNGMLMDASALDTYYVVHNVYFWSSIGSSPVLVPDLRYVPKTGNIAQSVVEYLIDGPSKWLAPVVQPLPDSIELDGRVVPNGTHDVQVSLSAKAAALSTKAGSGDLVRFVTQLRWSLLPEFPFSGAIDLQIGGAAVTVPASGQAYRDALPFLDRRQNNLQRYGVIDGRARIIVPSQAAPDILETDVNSDVVAAAITWDKQSAALVRSLPGGWSGLWIGHVVGGGVPPSYRRVDLRARSMGRPVWFEGPTGLALYVVADGRLMYVAPDTGRVVDVTPRGVAQVTAVAVSPDARRVALVAGGGLSMGLIAAAGGVPVIAGGLRALNPGLGPLASVGWTRMDRVVVVGGQHGGNVLREITVDGAVYLAQDDRSTGLTVTELVSYASDPTIDERGSVMLQSQDPDASWNVYDGYVPIEPLLPDGPEPTPSSSRGPAEEVKVLAPFFLDY